MESVSNKVVFNAPCPLVGVTCEIDDVSTWRQKTFGLVCTYAMGDKADRVKCWPFLLSYLSEFPDIDPG